MKTKPLVLAFSGRLQSGKDTSAAFLERNANLFWPQGWKDSFPKVEKIYFGGPMKDFAESFGISHELLWGTNEQKNTLTDICWQHLPHYPKIVSRVLQEKIAPLFSGHISELEFWDFECIVFNNCASNPELCKLIDKHMPWGRMTVREFLQQIGEEMFLDMDPQYWVKQWKSAVVRSSADVILVPDPRKPEQIKAIHDVGGIVFRLMRDPSNGANTHISEIALDKDRYDWDNFDEVIDNRNLAVSATNTAILERLLCRGELVDHNMNMNQVAWTNESEDAA